MNLDFFFAEPKLLTESFSLLGLELLIAEDIEISMFWAWPKGGKPKSDPYSLRALEFLEEKSVVTPVGWGWPNSLNELSKELLD